MAQERGGTSVTDPAQGSLRILVTQRALKNFGGTELYTVELAREMAARGHHVAIYTPRPGPLDKFVIPSGVKVVDRIEDVPFTPDIIHGHHHLPLMAALARFPNVPAIHVWHGVRPWVECVPRHPNIARHVVTSERMRPSITTQYGIDAARVELVPNYVDTRRFSHVREVAQRPRHALLFGQSGFEPEELRTLEAACNDNNLLLDKIGSAYGNARPRPEYFLPEYDLVFAVGRSAIEAMSVGCAVLPIVPQLAGTRVRSETLDDWAAKNFSPRYFQSAGRFNSGWMAAELAAWDPEDIARVTQRVRTEFTMQGAFDRYGAIYRDVLAEGVPPSAPDAISPYMDWLAGSADDVWIEGIKADQDNTKLTDQVKELEDITKSQDVQIRFLMRLLKNRLTDNVSVMKALEPARDLRSEILRSGLFDANWYLEVNPDVAAAGVDPLEHYLSNGASEGRNPSPHFDSVAFWQANPDLRGQGATPLEHLVEQLFRSESEPR